MRKKIAESKKEAQLEKAKSLIQKANEMDKEAEGKAAEERLRKKVAERKKEERKRSEKRKKKLYKDMNSAERREALKRNDDEAWQALKKDLLGESTTEKAEKEEENKTMHDDQPENPPVRIVTTRSFDGDYSAGKYKNIVTTTMTLSFWNVGSQVAGYGGATMKSRSVSSFNGSSTESSCSGTFSGGSNGVIHLYGDCAGLTLHLNGGHSVSGGGMIFKIPDPSVFQDED
ncbi:hypothetical protein [Sulfurovum sp.]|uniref:hypothetical protein n=1 Tax=Sulfurovum sp. TaxID=1969726 RepID=UPI0025D29E61|nr:hypothetical protein [Sulfurovum sp.]